jgi:hypothetical protein
MLVVLPLVGFVALLLVFRLRGSGWRSATILGATAWGILVVLITEGLSLPRWLTRAGLSTAWLSFDVVVLIYLWQASDSVAGGCEPHHRRCWSRGVSEPAQ